MTLSIARKNLMRSSLNILNHNCKICGSKIREITVKTLSAAYYYCDTCEFIAKDAVRQ